MTAEEASVWAERGQLWGGVQHQLVVPLPMTQSGRRAFFVGRPDPFTASEMRVARQLCRLFAGLDLQQPAYSRCPCAARAGHETAEDIGLTRREPAVLTLEPD